MKYAEQVSIASRRLRMSLERAKTAPSTADRDRAAKWARAWNRAIQIRIERQLRAASEENARWAKNAAPIAPAAALDAIAGKNNPANDL
jgi:hypothetical protein